MTNTSAPLFTDFQQQRIVDKQKAELYMQIYQYAAEDFLSTSDANIYSTLLQQYMVSIELQLDRLMKVLSTHTHVVPPHLHSCPDGVTSVVVSTTLVPNQAAAIQWVPLYKPVVTFTTGVAPNLSANFVIPGIASEGIVSPGLRRALPLPLTLTVTLPPILTGGLL